MSWRKRQKLFLLLFSSCVVAALAYYWTATPKATTEQKTLASTDALACALLVANTIGNDFEGLKADVAVAHAKSGRCDEAIRILDSLRENGFYGLGITLRTGVFRGPFHSVILAKTTALGRIASRCQKKSPPVGAAALAQLQQRAAKAKEYSEAYAIIEIAVEWAQQGELAQALTTLELVGHVIRRAGGDEQNHVPATIVDGLISVAQHLPVENLRQDLLAVLSRAFQQANTVEDRAIRIQKWVEISEEYVRLNLKREARNLLAQAFKTTLEMEQTGDRAESEQTIARAYSKLGEFDTALSLANRIQIDYKKQWALRDIAFELIKADQLNRAPTLLPSLTDFYENAQVLKAMAIKHVANGNPEQAYEAALVIPVSHYKADALLELARWKATRGDSKQAIKLLQQATEFAKDESRGALADSWERLAQIAVGYVEIGEREPARQLFRQLAQLNGAGGMLEAAAQRLAELNQYDLAVEVANSITKETFIDDAPNIPSEYFRANALTGIALKLAAMDLNNNSYRQSILRGIAYSLN